MTLTFERLPGMTNQNDFAPLLPVNWAVAKDAAGPGAFPLAFSIHAPA